jgi:hypothetical protein
MVLIIVYKWCVATCPGAPLGLLSAWRMQAQTKQTRLALLRAAVAKPGSGRLTGAGQASSKSEQIGSTGLPRHQAILVTI